MPWSGLALGPLLAGAGVLLLAAWLGTRFGRVPGRRGRAARQTAAAAGVLLTLAGVAAALASRWSAPAAFGWYLYRPLAEDGGPFGSPSTDVLAWQAAGAELTALGLAVLVLLACYYHGRRLVRRDAPG